jgi:aryl-alcohol dehydrogenase-like predicted oxidoreductase
VRSTWRQLFLDTAEIYGPFVNEELLARSLTGGATTSLATKFGLVSHLGGGSARLTAARRTSGPRSRAR